MSYNIDVFKVRKVENFSFSVTNFLELLKEQECHFEQINNEDGSITFELSSSTLQGTIEDDKFFVSTLHCCGSESGYEMEYILEPIFHESTGELIASCAWNGGDTINRVYVKNGEVEWCDLDF